jgi:DNA-binding transcriptional LysR family regulator
MYLTPSAVSQQLAGLAREVGVPLLERRGRSVVLTGTRAALEAMEAVAAARPDGVKVLSG